MTKHLTILGSTGSIGRQALEVADELGISVDAIAAGSNVDLLEQQIRKFHPAYAVLYEEDAARVLQDRIVDLPVTVLSGMDGLCTIAALDTVDTVLVSVVGMIGLKPTLAAIRAKKRIALANKETLVCAGSIVMREVKEYQAELIPVDSEHSAIFQSLQGCRRKEEVKKLLLTCSGGPFWNLSKEELTHVTLSQALEHPNWNMGNKITVDCSTLMNKGLELMEAMHLFQLPADQIEILIHRQSIVHSGVEFHDGAVIAQLGIPSMKLPIRYSFTYPYRQPSQDRALDLFQLHSLTFEKPDLLRFPCLRLAKEVAKTGGTAPAILNAANEIAVHQFLKGQIAFPAIYERVETALQKLPNTLNPDLEEILDADAKARELVSNI